MAPSLIGQTSLNPNESAGRPANANYFRQPRPTNSVSLSSVSACIFSLPSNVPRAMKLTTLLAIVAFAATAAALPQSRAETNAERMRRKMPPLPPRTLFDPTHATCTSSVPAHYQLYSDLATTKPLGKHGDPWSFHRPGPSYAWSIGSNSHIAALGIPLILSRDSSAPKGVHGLSRPYRTATRVWIQKLILNSRFSWMLWICSLTVICDSNSGTGPGYCCEGLWVACRKQ